MANIEFNWVETNSFPNKFTCRIFDFMLKLWSII